MHHQFALRMTTTKLLSSGVDILCTYAFGARSETSAYSSLATPLIRWLGVFDDDITRFGIPAHCVQPLSAADRARGASLLRHARLAARPRWAAHVNAMLQSNRKVEIQSLSAYNSAFLTTYLARKIITGAWC